MHFKCDVLERQVKDANNEHAAKMLLEKINEIQMLEDVLNDDNADIWKTAKMSIPRQILTFPSKLKTSQQDC